MKKKPAVPGSATRTVDPGNDAEGGEHASPSLPHERDQDATTQKPEPRAKMTQALKDVQSGQQDTDRRHATDEITDPQINADAPGSR